MFPLPNNSPAFLQDARNSSEILLSLKFLTNLEVSFSLITIIRLIGFTIYTTLPCKLFYYSSSTPFPSQYRSCVLCTKQSRGYPYSFLCSLLTGFPRGCRVNIATSYNYVCMKSCLATLSHATK